MSTRRRLSAQQIQELLFQDDDSNDEAESSDDNEEDDEEDSSAEEEAANESDNTDDTVEYDDSAFAWSAKEVAVRSRLSFTGTPGRKVPVADVENPLMYFELFITGEIVENIVVETNRYAGQLLHAATLKRKSRINKWVDVTVDELMVYLTIVLYQGIIQKSEEEMYWTTKPLLATPYILKMMTGRRFSLIDKCLHFCDNTSMPQTTSAAEKSFLKIKPFYDALIQRFSTVYVPEQNIAIDESLMLWKGRLQMKQYIPLKRARFGLKSYELCESGSGYIWTSIVHIGTAMNLRDSGDGLKSSKIVLTLVNDLLGQGYCLFLDNWYSSPALYRELVMKQTDAVGTVRLNRKNMPAELKKKIPRGQVIARYTSEMMAIKWMDKKEVTLLSTFHPNEMETVSNHRGDRQKPSAVIMYNQNMGAVDVADQMLVAYPTERKRKKIWYKKQFRHLINQSVLNSYILFLKDNGPKKSTHLAFRITLIEKILEKYHKTDDASRTGRRPSQEGNPLRLTERHFPKIIPPNEGKQAPTRRCSVCCSHYLASGSKKKSERKPDTCAQNVM